ncbi:uncharacterized protein L3040_007024 [Drepanopeziza brunnea f. sp. 'multigermtubi']|uniref:uncharacterized protein n=1 Tax=Drepanopeziza brunnea f. sp. 'multigermtubi' TaxID=698441 RepID=UPI002399DA36|nr:hypothetical protein L3040_007024 [Drepanopeziza brunnea f. sp. 'multigermtubi']
MGLHSTILRKKFGRSPHSARLAFLVFHPSFSVEKFLHNMVRPSPMSIKFVIANNDCGTSPPLVEDSNCFKMSSSLTFALQALLVRHEQYMHDAEKDRKALEHENAKSIEENRGLLDQLEDLNGTLEESETHIKSLEATLYSTRQELRHLELLASRTRDLEVQLAALEQEQDLLQRTLITTQEEERSAIQRWRKAERRICDLHGQLERIEREAKEEREKHVEVMGRMERQRAVEKELDTAAGRLKGAAAATTSNSKNGSNVVSHFVKDILQDNANLQMGIVELREMLMNSNDEVQTLREQLLMHQPMDDEGHASGPQTLRAELAPKEPAIEERAPQVISQALHIHHHYHTSKKEEIRRPKKKRISLNVALLTPPKGMQSPRANQSHDSASAILSQTSVTIPSPLTPNNRWSVQSGQMSEFAPSSVPSSPQSIYRQSGLFDRLDIDSSRPTSPSSSLDLMSPKFAPSFHHRKRGSEASTQSCLLASKFQSHVIHEERGDDIEEIEDVQPTPPLDDDPTPSHTSRDTEYFSTDHEEEHWTSSLRPRLRPSASHDSILSVSGIDIHTLKSRPSQITIRGGSALLRPPSRLGTPTVIVSSESSTVIPRATLSRQTQDSTAYLRSMRASGDGPRSISPSNSNERTKTKLGGWVFGRWGITPQKSAGGAGRSSSASPQSSPQQKQQQQQRAVSTPVVDPLKAFAGRAPGINQKGPILGFAKKIERAPSQVKAEVVDHDALREILMEGGAP